MMEQKQKFLALVSNLIDMRNFASIWVIIFAISNIKFLWNTVTVHLILMKRKIWLIQPSSIYNRVEQCLAEIRNNNNKINPTLFTSRKELYISQFIKHARCSSRYDDFRYRHICLVDRLLSQSYTALRLEKSFKKFYGRYQDFIEKHQRSVKVMVNNSSQG